MRLQEIAEIYRQMGIGTQAERDDLLKWSFDPPRDNGYTTFIVETPNSDQKQTQAVKEDPKNAQLA